MSPSLSALAARFLGWLRAGYPQGLPRGDYIAVLGVLHRHLTADEVESLAAELAAGAEPADPISPQDIRLLIAARVHEQADPHDVDRVYARLAEVGMPLTGGGLGPDGETEPRVDD